MVFLFPINMILPFCSKVIKTKMIFSRKNTFLDISSIIEKYDNHPRKYGISSDRKTEDDKKGFSVLLWRRL